MKMIRFGADQVLSGKGGTYTDDDIDALIAKGEEKTSEIQAKLQTDAKHNLADFKLLPDTDGGKDTFSFDGKNYRRDGDQTFGNFINLPQVSGCLISSVFTCEIRNTPISHASSHSSLTAPEKAKL